MGFFDSLIADNPLGQAWARDQRELGIEQRHGLALTTANEWGAHWSHERMDILDGTLNRLPADHVDPLRNFEIGGVGGWGAHEHDSIWLSSDPRTLDEAEKHPGTTSELAGHDHPVRQLEMTVAHEVGHEVADAHPEAVAQIQQLAGWQDGLDQWSAGVGDDDMSKILEWDEVARDGRRYRANPAGTSITSYVEDWVPMAPGEEVELEDGEVDSWRYARTGPSEYFAEMYTKAVNVPETLYQDLVATPQAMVAAFEHDPEMLARYQEAARRKQAQFDLMRTEIFGVDDALVEDRVGDLEAMIPSTDPRSMDSMTRQFRHEAQRAMTPEQLERLFEQTLARHGG